MRKEEREKEVIRPEVVHDSTSYFIINKPAGWVVNDAITVKHKLIIQNWIIKNFDFEIANSVEFRSGIVHRLDKETSGALIIAKTKKSFVNLQSQFKERVVKKKYIGLLHDILKEKTGDINVKIGRLPWRRDRFGVYQGGRESQTFYKVIGEYTNDNSKISEKFSFVEFKPITGRTHQIRVHSKFLGNPIVSDEFYAGRKRSRKDRLWCPRLFLHAKEISFISPDTKERVEYKVELASDLKEALNLLSPLSS